MVLQRSVRHSTLSTKKLEDKLKQLEEKVKEQEDKLREIYRTMGLIY